MCIDCGLAEPAGTSTKCLVCYLKDRSTKLFRTNRRWTELLDLYEHQGGRCAWSELPITIGTDAYLDHILPRAPGGRNEIANLQWLYSPVNRIKDCLTEEELSIVVQAMHARLAEGAHLPGVARSRDELGDDFSARRGYAEPLPATPVHRKSAAQESSSLPQDRGRYEG
jgi:hypothetical protein